MRLDEAILKVLKDAGRRLNAAELYAAIYMLALTDNELWEDWQAQDQETLRQDAKKETKDRKRYIKKESKKRKK